MLKKEKIVFVVLIFLAFLILFYTVWFNSQIHKAEILVKERESSLYNIINITNMLTKLELILSTYDSNKKVSENKAVFEIIDKLKKSGYDYPLYSPEHLEKIVQKIKTGGSVSEVLTHVKEYRKLYESKIKEYLRDKNNPKDFVFKLLEKDRKFKYFFVFLIFLFLFILFYFYEFYFSRIINSIKKLLIRFAQKDISYDDDIRSIEEETVNKNKDFGNLFSLLLINLKTVKSIIEKLHFASNKLSLALSNIDNSMDQQSSIISQQASSMNQVTASIEEYSITAREIADLAEDIKKAANEGKDEAEHGKEVVKELIEISNKFKGSFLDLAEINLNIVKKSKEIDHILNIMEEIVSEIHLLALNASIESAGAGEYGKRFGVIAQEIKDLADHSRESIEKIKKTISGFHNSLNSSAMQIEKSSYIVEDVLLKISETEKSFDQLISRVEQTDAYSINISNATAQQKIASEQIVVVMREISDVINISANEITMIKHNLKKIMDVSLLIGSILNTFKFSKNFNLIREIMEELLDIAKREDAKLDEELERIIQKNSFIEAVFVADNQGFLRHLVYSREDNNFNFEQYLYKDVSDREWYKIAVEEKSFTVTKPYISLISNELTITFTIPIYKGKEFRGVVAFDINYKKWVQEVSHGL